MKKQYNDILPKLPETVKHQLHLRDSAVHAFVSLLEEPECKDVYSVIDQMFVHYTKVISKLEGELLHMHKRLTPQDIARLQMEGGSEISTGSQGKVTLKTE